MKLFKFGNTITLIVIALFALFSLISSTKAQRLKKENKSLKSNIEVLNDSVRYYRIVVNGTDSLNAASAKELQYTKRELEKYKAKDKKILGQMSKGAKLESVQYINTYIRDTFKIELHDTILIDTTKTFKYNSEWTEINGCIYKGVIDMEVINKESLIVTQSAEKKKFLFIRLPVWLAGYKNKRIDIMSKNPNTYIQSIEYIGIH